MSHLSAQAHYRQRGRSFREDIARIESERMQAGPRLAMDGHTVIIPSLWYNVNAAAFWSGYGFAFDRSTYSWKRNANKPHNKRLYTPEAWLQSTRKQFFSFWPQLVADRTCAACKETFPPEDANRYLCNDCIDIVQVDGKEIE